MNQPKIDVKVVAEICFTVPAWETERVYSVLTRGDPNMASIWLELNGVLALLAGLVVLAVLGLLAALAWPRGLDLVPPAVGLERAGA